jgi:5'-3' exonuclease
MSSKSILLIDGNNLAARSFAAIQKTINLMSESGLPTTVMFGVLRALDAISLKFNDINSVIIFWDGGSKYRKKVFKYYKHNRKVESEKSGTIFGEPYFKELNTAREYFEKLKINQVNIRGIEADDLIGYFTAKFSSKYKVIIFSDDRDYYQLIKFKPYIYRPSSEKLMKPCDLKDDLKFEPKYFPKVLAYTGQKKDNIPTATGLLDENNVVKLVGIGNVSALKYLVRGNFNLKKSVEMIPEDDKWKNEITYENLKRNYKLSRIRIKDEQYMDWELKEIKKIYKQIQMNLEIKPKISSSKVIQITKYLGLRTINMNLILNKIGVEVI